jgi:hypothetical protein
MTYITSKLLSTITRLNGALSLEPCTTTAKAPTPLEWIPLQGCVGCAPGAVAKGRTPRD